MNGEWNYSKDSLRCWKHSRMWGADGSISMAASPRTNRCQDYDGCWDPEGVDVRKLDPVLLDFGNLRAAQKQKYRGEMFVAVLPNSPNDTFLEFFQIDKYTGEQKGILGIRAAEREDRT